MECQIFKFNLNLLAMFLSFSILEILNSLKNLNNFLVCFMAMSLHILFFWSTLKMFIKVWLIYSIMLISAVQHSDPVMHIICVYVCLCVYIYIYIHTYVYSFSHTIFHSCSIIRDIGPSRISLLIYSKCNSFHLSTPNSHPSHFLSPPPWLPQVCFLCP